MRRQRCPTREVTLDANAHPQLRRGARVILPERENLVMKNHGTMKCPIVSNFKQAEGMLNDHRPGYGATEPQDEVRQISHVIRRGRVNLVKRNIGIVRELL